jgi:hypothetical protein
MNNEPTRGTGGEIWTVELDDGSQCLALVGVPVPPYGAIVIKADGSAAGDETFLKTIQSAWPELWPQMREKLLSKIAAYQVDVDPSRDDFGACAGWTDPDTYQGDVSDIHLSFEFYCEPGYPVWDFFIRGTNIVHFQPVF